MSIYNIISIIIIEFSIRFIFLVSVHFSHLQSVKKLENLIQYAYLISYI